MTSAAAADPRITPREDEAITGLRGVAILLVVGLHMGIYGFSTGYLGVDVFFVLSGFLITRMLVGTRAPSLGTFYLRRARRLVPPALAMFVVLALFQHWLPASERPDRWGWVTAVTYLTNWGQVVGGTRYGAVAHTWSLSIEEQFYFLWPLCLLALTGLRRRVRPEYLLVGLAVASHVWATVAFANRPGVVAVFYRLDTHCGGLLLGAALAVWVRRRGLVFPDTVGRVASYAGPVLMLAGVVASDPLAHSRASFGIAMPVLEVGTATLILGLLTAPATLVSGVLTWGPTRFLGRLSYSLYLWHFPMLLASRRYQALYSYRYAVLIQLGYVAVPTLLSYFLLERPYLRSRGRA
jgi:peptidoglycan/LPS O-acetylase OafA/YrhL